MAPLDTSACNYFATFALARKLPDRKCREQPHAVAARYRNDRDSCAGGELMAERPSRRRRPIRVQVQTKRVEGKIELSEIIARLERGATISARRAKPTQSQRPR
jgi:hypothetical protein